jgi:hypothetical protein
VLAVVLPLRDISTSGLEIELSSVDPATESLPGR